MRHKVDWQSLRGGRVVSLSKFEPTILCDIRSWDYTLFSPEHFDMVWASPVCTEYSRALTMRPRRLENPMRWCSELRPAHVGHRESCHRAAEDPPMLGGRYLLQVRDSVQEADPTVDQHALETKGQRERVRGQSRKLLYSIPIRLSVSGISCSQEWRSPGWRLEDPSRTCEYKSFKEWRSPGWRVEDPSRGFLAHRAGGWKIRLGPGNISLLRSGARRAGG